MILILGSHDQHLANYFHREVKSLITADAMPSHCDLPVNSMDHHEDIGLKSVFCSIPLPEMVPVSFLAAFQLKIPRISPHTIWQPPEYKS